EWPSRFSEWWEWGHSLINHLPGALQYTYLLTTYSLLRTSQTVHARLSPDFSSAPPPYHPSPLLIACRFCRATPSQGGSGSGLLVLPPALRCLCWAVVKRRQRPSRR